MPRWGRGRRGRGMGWGNGNWFGAGGWWGNGWPRGYCRWYYWQNYMNQNSISTPQTPNPVIQSNLIYWPRGGGWWWNYPPGWNYNFNYGNQPTMIQPIQTSTESIEEVKKRAREMLKKAITGSMYPGSMNATILYNGNVIGYLWDNVPLDKLDFGQISNNGGKWYIPLIYENRIVGYLLI